MKEKDEIIEHFCYKKQREINSESSKKEKKIID